MKPILQGLAVIFAFSVAVPVINEEDVDQIRAGNEQKLLANVRQMILEGRRSGEGHFSADGGRMIFQSERE